MRASFIAVAISLLFIRNAVAQGCPSCTATNFHCPAEDNSQALVGETYSNTGSSCCGNTLTCDYQGGGTTVTYTCQYSGTSGALTLDSDHGFCPANAPAGAQRRGVLGARAINSRVARRSPQRKREVKDAIEGMSARRDLGKGKASRTTSE